MITKEEIEAQIADLNNQVLMCQGALQLANNQLKILTEKENKKKVSK